MVVIDGLLEGGMDRYILARISKHILGGCFVQYTIGSIGRSFEVRLAKVKPV